jgi:hypothetical protein
MAMPIGACFSAVVTLGELGGETGAAGGDTLSGSVGDRAAIALLYSDSFDCRAILPR